LALDPARGWPDRVGRQHSAIPLLADIRGAILLRPDGVFLQLGWDQDSQQHPKELAELPSTAALVAGAERYSWLQSLLPRRPPDARSCTTCEGAGRISVVGAGGGVFCESCGALGWIAA